MPSPEAVFSTSHFNERTAFDSAVFGFAAVLALAMAAVLRQALAGQPLWPG